uniref:Helicase ATP-binding domain-containing protein n=1 Tax=viral metagenome TaxID=1070528 RepID=A0A6C0LXM9_9ZZZZ
MDVPNDAIIPVDTIKGANVIADMDSVVTSTSTWTRGPPQPNKEANYFNLKDNKSANGGAGYNLFPRQELAVQKFALQKKKASMLFHSVGSGKTITSISLAINLLNWNLEKDQRVIQVVTPTSIFEPGFLSDIMKAIPNIILDGRDTENKLGRHRQEMGRVYSFRYFGKHRGSTTNDTRKTPFESTGFYIHAIEYRDFSRLYMKFNEKSHLIKNNFSNKVVIFDEAHRLFRQFDMCDPKSMIIDKYIYNMLLEDSKHVIFMTGTPMKEDLVSMFKLYNLIDALNNPDGESVFNIDKLSNYDKYIKFSSTQELGFNTMYGLQRSFTEWGSFMMSIMKRSQTSQSNNYIMNGWFTNVINVEETTELEKELNTHLFNKKGSSWWSTFNNIYVRLTSSTDRNKVEDQKGGEYDADYDNNEHKCEMIIGSYNAENYGMEDTDSEKISKVMNHYLMSIKNGIIKTRKDKSKKDSELTPDEIKLFKEKVIKIIKKGVYDLQVHQIDYLSDVMNNSVGSDKKIETYADLITQYDDDKEQLISMEIDIEKINQSLPKDSFLLEKFKGIMDYIQERNKHPTSQIFAKPEIDVVTKMRSFESAVLTMDTERIYEVIDNMEHDSDEMRNLDLPKDPIEEGQIKYQQIIDNQKNSDPDLDFSIKYENGIIDKVTGVATGIKDDVVRVATGMKDDVVDAVTGIKGVAEDIKEAAVNIKGDVEEYGILPSIISRVFAGYLTLTSDLNAGLIGGKKYDKKVLDECTSEFKRFMFATKLKGQKNVSNMINVLKPETRDSINDYYNKLFEKKELLKESSKEDLRAMRLKKYDNTTGTRKNGAGQEKGTRKNGGGGRMRVRQAESASYVPDPLTKQRDNDRYNRIREEDEKKAEEEKKKAEERALKPFSGTANRAGEGPIFEHFNVKFDSINAEFKKAFVNESALYHFLKEESEANLKLLQKITKPAEQNSVFEGKIQLYTDLIKFYGNVIDASKLQHSTLFENISNIKRLFLNKLTSSNTKQDGGGGVAIFQYVLGIMGYVLETIVSGSVPIFQTLSSMIHGAAATISNVAIVAGLNIASTALSMGCGLIGSAIGLVFSHPIIALFALIMIGFTIKSWAWRHLMSAFIHFLKFSGYTFMSVVEYGTNITYFTGQKYGGEYSAKRKSEMKLMFKSLYYGFFNGLITLRYQTEWDQLRRAKKLGDRTSITHYMYSLLKNDNNSFIGYKLANIIADSKDFISSVNPEMKSINSPIFDLLKHTNISLFDKVNKSTDIDLIKKGDDKVIVYPNLAVNVIMNTYTPEQSLLYNALEKKDVNIITPLRLEFLPCFFNQTISANKRYISNCYDNIHSITNSKLQISGNPIVKYDPLTNTYVDNRKEEYQTEIKSEKFDKLLNRLLLMKTGYMVDEDNGFLVTQPHITSKRIYGRSMVSDAADNVRIADKGILAIDDENDDDHDDAVEDAINKFINSEAGGQDAFRYLNTADDPCELEACKEKYKTDPRCRNTAIGVAKNIHVTNRMSANKIINDIGNGNALGFKDATKILQKGVENVEGPNCSMKQISDGISANKKYYNFLPFVYSSSDVVGLNLFAKYLDGKGFKYKIMHDESPDSMRASEEAIQTNYSIKPINERDAYDYYLKNIKKDAEYIANHRIEGDAPADQRVSVFNLLNPNDDVAPAWVTSIKDAGDPICILLHPFKTEGIDGKYNPAIFFLDNPRNYGDYNQLCGRILRTYGQPNSTNFTNYDPEKVKQKNSENRLKRVYYGSSKYNADADKTYDANDRLFGEYLTTLKDSGNKKDEVNDATTLRGEDGHSNIVETLKRAYPIITSTEIVFYEMAMSNYGKYYTKNKDVHKRADKITELSDIEFGQLEDFFYTRIPEVSSTRSVIGKGLSPIEKDNEILNFKDQISTFLTNDIFNQAFLNISSLLGLGTIIPSISHVKLYEESNKQPYKMLRSRIGRINDYYSQLGDTYTDGDYARLTFSKLQRLSSTLENYNIYIGMKRKYAYITKLYLAYDAKSSIRNWIPNQRSANPFYNDKKPTIEINDDFNISVANALYTQKIIELLNPSFGLKLLNENRIGVMSVDETNKYIKEFDALEIDHVSDPTNSMYRLLKPIGAENKYHFNEPLFKEYMKIIDMYDINNMNLNNQSIELEDYKKLKKNGSEFTTLIKSYVSGEDSDNGGQIQDLTDISLIYNNDDPDAPNEWETLRPWNDVFSNTSDDKLHNIIHINRSSEYSDYMIRTKDAGPLDHQDVVNDNYFIEHGNAYVDRRIINLIKQYNSQIYENIVFLETNQPNMDETYKHIDNIVRFFKHGFDKKCIFDVLPQGAAIPPPIFADIDVDAIPEDLEDYIKDQTDAILNYIKEFLPGANNGDANISESYKEIGKIDSVLLNMSTIDKPKEQRAIVYKQIYFRQSKIFTTFFNAQGDVNESKIRLCKNLLYLVFLYKQLYNIRVKRDAAAAVVAAADADRERLDAQEQVINNAIAEDGQQGVAARAADVNVGNIIDGVRRPDPADLGGARNKTRRKSKGKSKRKSKRKSRRKSKRKSKRSTHTNH